MEPSLLNVLHAIGWLHLSMAWKVHTVELDKYMEKNQEGAVAGRGGGRNSMNHVAIFNLEDHWNDV